MKKFANVLQLKINLIDAKPSIYRTIYYNSDTTFLELHVAIQEAMGWDTSHLFAFRKGLDIQIGLEFKDDFMDTMPLSTKINKFLAKEKDRIKYEYDFGDGWLHDIEVQKVIPEIDLQHLPYCLKGKGACPLEDCGGVWGYMDILEIAKNIKHPQYEEMNEYYDFENFETDVFEIDLVNEIFSDFKECVKEHKAIIKQMESSV